MATLKFLVCLMIFGISASALSQPTQKYGPTHVKEHRSRPYAFSYGITDLYAGNNYDRKEESDGNHVTGSYSVQLPDGRMQIVKYVADHDKGFVADVSYQGKASYPPPQKDQHVFIVPAPHHPSPSYEERPVKPIIPKYNRPPVHEAPFKPVIHSHYKPEFNPHKIQVKPPPPKYKPKPPPSHRPQYKPIYSPHKPEIVPFEDPYKPIHSEYKPLPPHEVPFKPSHPKRKPHSPYEEAFKPIPLPQKPHSSYEEAFKPIYPEHKPQSPYEEAFKPIPLEHIPQSPYEETFKPIPFEHKPQSPYEEEFKPIPFEHKPQSPYEEEFKPIPFEHKPQSPYEEEFKPIPFEHKPQSPYEEEFKPIPFEHKPQSPYEEEFKPILLEQQPYSPYEEAFKPTPLEHKPQLPYDEPFKPIQEEYEPPHSPDPYVQDVPTTVYAKLKAKRNKYEPFNSHKTPSKLEENLDEKFPDPFISVDQEIHSPNLEPIQNIKPISPHQQEQPIHNLASISIYTPIIRPSVPKKNNFPEDGFFQEHNNFYENEQGGFSGDEPTFNPSIITDDIPFLEGDIPVEHFDTGPLFKSGQDKYRGESRRRPTFNSPKQREETNSHFKRSPFKTQTELQVPNQLNDDGTEGGNEHLRPNSRSDFIEANDDDKYEALPQIDDESHSDQNEDTSTKSSKEADNEEQSQIQMTPTKLDQMKDSNTHKPAAERSKGKLFVRPGGTTGSKTPMLPSSQPSKASSLDKDKKEEDDSPIYSKEQNHPPQHLDAEITSTVVKPIDEILHPEDTQHESMRIPSQKVGENESSALLKSKQ